MPPPFDTGSVIPNAQSAVIPPGKLRDYSLSSTHPEGRHKARVFRSMLGFEQDDWQNLSHQLFEGLQVANVADVRLGYRGGYRAEVPIMVTGPNGRSAIVTTGWYVANDDPRPHLTSAYIEA